MSRTSITSDPCCSTPADMMSVDETRAALLQQAEPVTGIEHLGLNAALDRVLASDLDSPIAVPDFDNSAMDGYAFHSQDLEQAVSSGLTISQRIPAGAVGQPLQRGTAARIFTGAPVPAGADTVVMQEHCRIEQERVWLEKSVAAGANIRPRGNAIAGGARLLDSGTPMTPARLGLAASVGITGIDVFQRLKVAHFSSGDELVEPGQPLRSGQIYNSNRTLLNTLLGKQGCEVIDLGTVPDSFEATRDILMSAAAQADVVMSTGGVSVGEEDHIKSALQSVGSLDLWRVRMKPGKPLAFGRIESVPFIGLPGNPVSVFVTFLLFARPFLLKRQGRNDHVPCMYPVRAGFEHAAGPRREFARVRLHDDPEQGPVAECYARQGSDVLASVAWADGLVEIPENERIRQGNTVRFLPFSEWL